MKHVDLFSGIGGFALAAQTVWGKEYENVLFCDNNKFCQEVIRKNFGKDSMIYGDIREIIVHTLSTDGGRKNNEQLQNEKRKVCQDRREDIQSKDRKACSDNSQQSGTVIANPESWQSGEQTEQKRWKDISRGNIEIDLLTGGFPCQPFSAAGKRRGTEDNRYLWPEMFRVIQDFKPRWIIAENVYGILNIKQGVVFKEVCADLESEDYTVQAFIIPAVSVNAPHRRDRVWIVAYNNKWESRPRNESESRETTYLKPLSNIRNANASYTISDGYKKRSQETRESFRQSEQRRMCEPQRKNSNASDTKSARLERRMRNSEDKKRSDISTIKHNRNEMGSKIRCDNRSTWEANWLEVATKLCGVDDGLPYELDGFKLSKAGHRVERPKALGNAIVPQIAIEIMKAIKEYDSKMKYKN